MGRAQGFKDMVDPFRGIIGNKRGTKETDQEVKVRSEANNTVLVQLAKDLPQIQAALEAYLKQEEDTYDIWQTDPAAWREDVFSLLGPYWNTPQNDVRQLKNCLAQGILAKAALSKLNQNNKLADSDKVFVLKHFITPDNIETITQSPAATLKLLQQDADDLYSAKAAYLQAQLLLRGGEPMIAAILNNDSDNKLRYSNVRRDILGRFSRGKLLPYLTEEAATQIMEKDQANGPLFQEHHLKMSLIDALKKEKARQDSLAST